MSAVSKLLLLLLDGLHPHCSCFKHKPRSQQFRGKAVNMAAHFYERQFSVCSSGQNDARLGTSKTVDGRSQYEQQLRMHQMLHPVRAKKVAQPEARREWDGTSWKEAMLRVLISLWPSSWPWISLWCKNFVASTVCKEIIPVQNLCRAKL